MTRLLNKFKNVTSEFFSSLNDLVKPDLILLYHLAGKIFFNARFLRFALYLPYIFCFASRLRILVWQKICLNTLLLVQPSINNHPFNGPRPNGNALSVTQTFSNSSPLS